MQFQRLLFRSSLQLVSVTTAAVTFHLMPPFVIFKNRENYKPRNNEIESS